MKKIIAVIVLLTTLLLANILNAQEKKLETIQIKSSPQCSMCKESIEKVLAFEKGVKMSVVDVTTKIITVEYQADKTNPGKIRKAISKTGYDADTVKADAKAYKRLPACCKKPDDPAFKQH